jgi:hypothetical protein
MTHFDEAMKCAERARDLARDLDQVRTPGDLRQVAAGLRLELDCIIQRLADGQDQLRTLAAGDREGKVRADALPTSRASAVTIRPKSGTQRAAVLLALYRWGDLTDFEIQERLKIDQNSERPRRGELVDGGMVAPLLNADGLGITRRHKGTDWQLWTLTETGATVAWDLSGEERERGEGGIQPVQSLF